MYPPDFKARFDQFLYLKINNRLEKERTKIELPNNFYMLDNSVGFNFFYRYKDTSIFYFTYITKLDRIERHPDFIIFNGDMKPIFPPNHILYKLG